MSGTLQEAEAEVVERAVLEHAGEGASSSRGGEPSTAPGVGGFDMVAASEWPGVPEQLVLLTPSQCRTLWRQFSSDTSYTVQQARAARNSSLNLQHEPASGDPRDSWAD